MRGPRRRGLRLQDYDYAGEGLYFVTTCTVHRACLFGDVVDAQMRLNDSGHAVEAAWHDLPRHYPGVRLDAFVVMPNHIHGVIALFDPVGAGFKPAPAAGTRRTIDHAAIGCSPPAAHSTDVRTFGGFAAGAGLKPAPTGHCPSLIELVRAFKTFSARRINAMRGTPGRAIWQRTFHDHVIRNDHALERIRHYIAANPANWSTDPEHPRRVRDAGATQASPLEDDDWWEDVHTRSTP